MRKHETLRGEIRYTSRKPGREGAERGREYFLITKHTDGRRTLRAHCEIDDAPSVMRDVVLTVSEKWVPKEGYSRLSVADEEVGAAWFRFYWDHATCEGWQADSGDFTERVDYEAPPELFGMHPIQGDAWYLNAMDLSQGPHVKTFDRYLITSLDHRGATGPSLVWREPGMVVEFIGEEQVNVPAGTFDALHFCYGKRDSEEAGENAPGKHPTYHIWVTADGDYVFLKGSIGGYMMTHYELVSLERTPADPD